VCRRNCIRCQIVRRLVSAIAVLLQAPHNDPVQIATNEPAKGRWFGAPVHRHVGERVPNHARAPVLIFDFYQLKALHAARSSRRWVADNGFIL
jgi:hypothetical protein